MNPIAVFYEGSADVAQRYLPYALHCCLVVDANKQTLGISTTTHDFPLPRGDGFVRVVSLEYTTKLIIVATKAVAEDIEEKAVARIEPLQLRQRLVWLPEGFVITPRSPSLAPDGWGLPNNTPGGPLREVIINRFEHNLYPDIMYVRRKDIANAKLGEDIFSDYPLCFEPAFYALEFPKRIPGTKLNFVGIITINNIIDASELNDSNVFINQALQSSRIVLDPVFEQEQAVWFCHRPQLIEYLYSNQNQTAPFAIKSDFIAQVFYRTNQIRAAAGKLLLYPPLRGWYTTLSSASVEQNILGAALAHGSSEFTPGYEYFPSRVSRVGADEDIAHAENLAFHSMLPRNPNESDAEYAKRMANAVVLGWLTSPGHYANMIGDYVHPSYPNSAAGFLEVDKGSGTLRKDQAPPYTSDPVPVESPTDGLFAVQHFRGRDTWVSYGNAVWYGDAGVVSWNGPSNPVEDFTRYMQATPGGYMPNHQCVFIKGHAIHVAPRLGPHHSERYDKIYVIAAGAFVDEGTSLTKEVYVTALLCKTYEGQLGTCTYILTVTPLSGDPIVLCTYTTEHAISAGVARFSPNGKKCILNIPIKVSNNHIPMINMLQINFGYNYDDPTYNKIGVDLEFMEFTVLGITGSFSGACTQVHRSSVTVDVTVDSYLINEGDDVWRYNYYKQQCSSTYKWQAAYDETNTLVFAEVELDILTEQSGQIKSTDNFVTVGQLGGIGTGFGIQTRNKWNTLRYKSKIKFPTGYEIQWLDMVGSVARSSGFILAFHYLDILQPEEAVYTRLDVSPEYYDKRVHATFVANNNVLFTANDVALFFSAEDADGLGARAGADILMARPFALGTNVNTNRLNWHICLPLGWVDKYSPNAEYALINAYKQSYTATLFLPVFIYNEYINHNTNTLSFSSSLSPWIASYLGDALPHLGVPGYVQVNKLKYKNEYITFIGLVQSADVTFNLEFASISKRWNPLGPVSTGYPRTSGDPVIFVLSSIDLKEITGIADLSDNIYPLGVI